jgi:2-hydroxycyclohexanecarboxyl-CoA dehydrogenase
MDLGLAGKVVLVTGAGRGVGRAIGRAFVAEGAKVAFHYRTSQGGAADEVEEARRRGGEAVAVSADLTDPEAVDRLVLEVEGRLGPVDVLVHNAASSLQKPFLESTVEEWERQFGATVFGLLHLLRRVLPGMVERRQGSVVVLTGESGRVGEAKLAVTAAARAAAMALTKSLAREYGRHGVRLNAVALGLVHTPGLAEERGAYDARLERLLRFYPLGRLGEPEDVPPLVLLLASPQAGWITGQVYGVNGGYAMP